MTLDQLRVFVAVADRQHMTRAAHALDLAQSAVSKAITSLEGEVGFRLFDRVGRNIRLTEAGAAYRSEALLLLAAADRLLAWAAAQRGRMTAKQSTVSIKSRVVQQAQARELLRSKIAAAPEID